MLHAKFNRYKDISLYGLLVYEMSDDLHYIARNNEDLPFATDEVAVQKMKVWSKYLNYAVIIVSILVLIG